MNVEKIIRNETYNIDDNRIYEVGDDGIIFRNEMKIKYEDREKYLNEEAKKLNIVDIVETAALIGVKYGNGNILEEAEGVVKANPLSMVSEVIETLNKKS